MRYFAILVFTLLGSVLISCTDENVQEKFEQSRFQRHVCVMEFTGTWCSQCPEGAITLNYLVGKAYKGQAFALAFHNNDVYSIPAEAELFRIFKWEGYPAYVTDMRDVGQMNEGTCGTSIDRSLYDDKTHCGVAVSSVCSLSDRKINVTARIFPEIAMNYSIAVYLVEDSVVGEQLMSTGTVQSDYTHRHVVRAMLTSDVKGDDLGLLSAEEETLRNYTVIAEEDWEISDLYVAVLAIDKDGHVNNMAYCKADGGTMDYKYVNN